MDCIASSLWLLFLAAEHLEEDYDQRYEGGNHQDVYQCLEELSHGQRVTPSP